MLRMRRASPHGKWIETTRRKPVRAEKKAASFRPDIASRDAPRFGNALRRFAVRRPVSGLVSSGALVQFRPRAACLPIRLTQRTVAFGATRTDLPLRGQCRGG